MKVACFICLTATAFVGCTSIGRPPAVPGRSQYPLALCFVPEVDYIPEVDDWPSHQVDPDEVTRALSDWKKKSRWVEARITPEVVKSLSGWAQREMTQYNSVPAVSKVVLKPIAHHKRHRKILLEGTIDTLPSHSPGIITRWLKIYLIYDIDSRKIIRATVTIRGQKLE
jgi:hypothetical protein